MIPAELPYFVIGNESACVYCGDTPSQLDHVIPVSYQTVEDDNRISRRLTRFGPVAHSCAECNQRLKGSLQDSFDARCQWMSQRIGTRALPVYWSNEEVQKMDHKLKTFIRHVRSRRLWLRARADWYGSREYLLTLEPLLWQEELQPFRPKANAFLIRYFNDTLNLVKIIYNPDSRR